MNAEANPNFTSSCGTDNNIAISLNVTANNNAKPLDGTTNNDAKSLDGTANNNAKSLDGTTNNNSKSLDGTIHNNAKFLAVTANNNVSSVSKPNETRYLGTSKREVPNLIPISRRINITSSESSEVDNCEISGKIKANSSSTSETTQPLVDQTSKLTANTNVIPGKEAIILNEIDIFLLSEANKEMDKIKAANFKIITKQIEAIINLTFGREVSITNENSKILAAEVKKEINELIILNVKANANQIAINANVTSEKGLPSTNEKAKKLAETNEKIKRIMAANVNDIANKIAKNIIASIRPTS